jgi:hypothetical protein
MSFSNGSRWVNYLKYELKLRNVFELFSQHRSVPSAKGQVYSVIHFHEHIALRRQMKFFNVVKIHDRISMNAKKTIWVEQRLESLDALPNQMGRVPDMESDMIP